MPASPSPSHRVAIIGAGSIGTAWAVVFAAAGAAVRLQDVSPARLSAAGAEIADRLDDLASYGLLDRPRAEIIGLIEAVPDLERALAGADHVQECAPEDRALKMALFRQMDAVAPPEAVLASSSSFMPASVFADGLPGRGRCLVAHPGNPPTLLRVVEIVPAPQTDPDALARTEALMTACSMAPVVVRREVEGFLFNRLQGALLREAYCLVRDGVASVADIDRVMTEGLGPRWAVIGPFETVDLNTRGGIAAHAQRMGPAYARMGAERGQHDPWTPDLVASVTAERRAALPLDQWDARVRWRDRALMDLVRVRRASRRKEG